MQNLEKLTELAQALPENVKGNALALISRMGEVIEGFGDKPLEWRPELMKHVQGTSDRTRLPKGTPIGGFVLGESILAQPFPLIPIRMWTSRQYWDPNPENAKMLCNSPDGTVGYQFGECRVCPYSKFDTENNKSQCNKTFSVLNIAADLSNVFQVNFSKSNYMNGIDWQSLMKKAGVAPHKRIYALSSQTSTKAKNVELIKAEPVTDNKVEGAILDFVQELSNLCGEDRKEMLLKFHEMAKNKAERQLTIEAPADMVLIADQTEVAVAETVETTETAAKTKPTKYKM